MVPGLKFFFECGTADETEDRNGNGIIDSIDDTKDLISALINKGSIRRMIFIIMKLRAANMMFPPGL